MRLFVVTEVEVIVKSDSIERIKKKGMWILRKISTIFITVYWLPFYCLKKHSIQNTIFCDCFVMFEGYALKKNNWGDDLNFSFLNDIVDVDFSFIPFDRTLMRVKRYLLIGSIIGFGNLDNTIICGSGIKNPYIKLKGVPKKIYSVRGPKTREVLLKNNIECPQCYGDPALMLPVFYKPEISKKYKYGFIPNEATLMSEVMSCVSRMGLKKDEYLIIDMKSYNEWTEIIDKILSCDNIVSESLHGLIVAETYHVPSVWVEFDAHVDYWSFKYLDFYESIGKYNEHSLMLKPNEDVKFIVEHALAKWEEANIDYSKLLSYFPFPVCRNKIVCR